jgi:hypothetical protein
MNSDRVARATAMSAGRGPELPTPQPGLAPGSAPAQAARILTAMRADAHLRRLHAVTDHELDLLAGVSLMGDLHSPSDLIFILNVLRSVLKNSGPTPPAARS